MRMNLMGVGEAGAVPMINYHKKSGRLYPSTLPNRKHPMTWAWLRHPSHVNSPHLQKIYMNISKYGRDHCRVSLTKCPWDAWSTSSFYTPGSWELTDLHKTWAGNLIFNSQYLLEASICDRLRLCVLLLQYVPCLAFNKMFCLSQGKGATPPSCLPVGNFPGFPNACFGLQHWSQAL